jgi:hypothetical protein
MEVSNASTCLSHIAQPHTDCMCEHGCKYSLAARCGIVIKIRLNL